MSKKEFLMLTPLLKKINQFRKEYQSLSSEYQEICDSEIKLYLSGKQEHEVTFNNIKDIIINNQ